MRVLVVLVTSSGYWSKSRPGGGGGGGGQVAMTTGFVSVAGEIPGRLARDGACAVCGNIYFSLLHVLDHA